MKSRRAVILRRLGGTACFIIGIIASILPLVPGWLFIGVGLYLLSIDSPGLDSRVKGLRMRYRLFDRVMSEVEKRFKVGDDEVL